MRAAKAEPPLVVHTECSDGWGGQEIRILAEMRGMRRFGFATALIAPAHSQIYQRAAREGFAVYPVSFKSKAHLPSWLALYRRFSRLRPAVVNTHSSKDSWLAGAMARILRAPLVIRTRHVSTPIGSTFSYRHFPHLILTTSEAIRRDLIDRGLPPAKIISVPTGIDVDRFRFSETWRRQVRRELNIADNEVLVGNICVLRSWKGLDFFIDTAAAMPENFKFILVGDGPQRQHLEHKAKALQLGGRLIFAGYQERVERYFAALDVFFFTSYASEGVPQALLQALSNGLPVVATKIPSILEALARSPCILIDYGRFKAASSALRRAAAQGRLSKPQEEAQRVWLRATHGLEHMWETIRLIYASHEVSSPSAM